MMDSDKRKQITSFLHLLCRFRDEDASIYNSMAPGYDRFAKVWDEEFARPALEHLLETSSKRTPMGGRILEAGCGTGLRIPSIAKYFDPDEIVGLDISEAMLDFARRRHYSQSVSFVRGNFLSLPFEDNTFDAVVATWAIETSSNPGRAVSEFLRVIKPGGVVAYSFVQIPESLDAESNPVELAPGKLFESLREALSPAFVPFHNCEKSELRYFADGVISTVILGKCCEVSPRILPKPFNEFEEYFD